MKTSRAQVHRLLSPTNRSATAKTLVRAAEALGARWKIDLVAKAKRGLPKEYLNFVKSLPRTDLVHALQEERSRR